MNLEIPINPEKKLPQNLHEAPTIAPGKQIPAQMIDLFDSGIKSIPCALPKVPGYLLEGELGRGGMGVVYLARQIRLNRLVALKMILSGSLACEKTRYRFLAEAEAIARVQHPGIVQVYEFGMHENNPYFALEYVKGGSLDKKLAGTPLHPVEAADLVQKLARAVQSAHDQGIIHRDIKPANVLLAEESSSSSSTTHQKLSEGHTHLRTWLPKLTDFGLVKQAGQDMTVTGHIMGTPSYMAPELADCKKAVGHSVDIYALGAILYECLTGRPPFKAATPLDTVLQLVNEEPVSVRQLQPRTPRGLELICMKCLNKVPAKRYASAQLLAEDLGRFLAGEPVQAQPPHLLPRVSEWFRRHPWALINLFVITCAILISATYGFWTRSEEANWHRLIAEGKVERMEDRPEAAIKKLTAAAKLYQEPRLYDEAVEALKPKVSTKLIGSAYWMFLTHNKMNTGSSAPGDVPVTSRDPVRSELLAKPTKATLSPDRKLLALNGERKDSIVLVDAESKRLIRSLWPTPGRPKYWYQQVHHGNDLLVGGQAVFSPDGRYIASHLFDLDKSENTTRYYAVIWEVESGQEYLRLPDHAGSELDFTQEGLVVVDRKGLKTTIWQPVALHDALENRHALNWMHAMPENPAANHSMIFIDNAAQWVNQKTMIPAIVVKIIIIFLPWIAVYFLSRHLAMCRKQGKLPKPAYLIGSLVLGTLAIIGGFLFLFTYFNTLGWNWEDLFHGTSLYLWFFGSILAGTQLLVLTANAYRVAEFGDEWKEVSLLRFASKPRTTR